MTWNPSSSLTVYYTYYIIMREIWPGYTPNYIRCRTNYCRKSRNLTLFVLAFIFLLSLSRILWKLGRGGKGGGTNLLSDSFISCYETFPSVYYWNTRRVNVLNYTTVVNLRIYSDSGRQRQSRIRIYIAVQIMMIVFKTSKSKRVQLNLSIVTHICICIGLLSVNNKFFFPNNVRYFYLNETYIHVLHSIPNFELFLRILSCNDVKKKKDKTHIQKQIKYL